MNTRTRIITALALAAGIVSAPIAANATPEPYVLVAWTINTPEFDGSGDVWGGGGQTDPIPLPTSSTDLNQIKPLVPCGRWVQIDLYNNDQITADLLAGGVLYGPSNPQESPAPVNPWYIASWYSGDCLVTPLPPTADDFCGIDNDKINVPADTAEISYLRESAAGSTPGESVTTVTAVLNLPHYAWEPDAQTTWVLILTDTKCPSTEPPCPTNTTETDHGCVPTGEPTPHATPVPTLADTGLTDDPLQFAAILFVGLILLAGGVILVVVRSRRTA